MAKQTSLDRCRVAACCDAACCAGSDAGATSKPRHAESATLPGYLLQLLKPFFCKEFRQQEVQNREDLCGVVLDRSAGEQELAGALQLAQAFVPLGSGIFYRVTLVQYAVAPAQLVQELSLSFRV